MKILPKLEEVKEFAKTGKYSVVPVSCEILSDFTTPIETMRILKNVSTHCYMLESAQADETWGRYTFLGFEPKLSITCSNGDMTIGEEIIHTDDPESVPDAPSGSWLGEELPPPEERPAKRTIFKPRSRKPSFI